MWSCRCRMPATADCLHGGGRTCPTSPATCCWSAFPAPLEHGSRSQRIATAEARSLRGMQFSKVRLSASCRDARRLLRVPGNAGHAPHCLDTTIAAHLFPNALPTDRGKDFVISVTPAHNPDAQPVGNKDAITIT